MILCNKLILFFYSQAVRSLGLNPSQQDINQYSIKYDDEGKGFVDFNTFLLIVYDNNDFIMYFYNVFYNVINYFIIIL